jgi:hypothetical protein
MTDRIAVFAQHMLLIQPLGGVIFDPAAALAIAELPTSPPAPPVATCSSSAYKHSTKQVCTLWITQHAWAAAFLVQQDGSLVSALPV